MERKRHRAQRKRERERMRERATQEGRKKKERNVAEEKGKESEEAHRPKTHSRSVKTKELPSWPFLLITTICPTSELIVEAGTSYTLVFFIKKKRKREEGEKKEEQEKETQSKSHEQGK